MRIVARFGALRLAEKFIALSSALVLLTSASVAVFVIRAERSRGREDLLKRGLNTAELLAQNAEYAVYTEDPAALEALVSVIEIDTDVQYVAIVNREGRTLAAKERDGRTIQPAPTGGLAGLLRGERISHEEFVGREDGRPYIEIVASVRSEGIVGRVRKAPRLPGHLRLGLSLAALERKTRLFMAAVAGLTLLLIGVGVALTVVMAQRISAPIERLGQVAREIGGGRLDFRVPEEGTAEVASLGRAFNAMLGRLGDSHVELQAQAESLATANALLQSEVAERRRAEQALVESQERYALAARAANDGLWDWNLETGEIYFSPRWKAMLGLPDDHVANGIEDWMGLVDPEDVGALRAQIDQHLEGATDQLHSLHRMRHPAGLRWVLCRGLAVRDAAGRPVRMAGSQTDVTAQKIAEDRLIHDALHDHLTGLPNRALFTDRLHHAIQRSAQHLARKRQRPFAVLFVDLDRFKVINDSLGHLTGDRLLMEVASRISASLRPGDTAARLGGDEFAVLLEEIGAAPEVEAVARRLVECIAEPFVTDGQTLYTSASVGIAIAGGDSRSAEEVLRNADIAMYRAKGQGGRYEVFDESMHAETAGRLRLETDLRGAQERGELALYYQPILSMRTGDLVGLEALLRWRHPERGLVPCVDFIPILEETQLIVPVGRFVLQEACRQRQEWRERYPASELKLSVNVCSAQFGNAALARDVRQALEASALPSRYLAIEITESALLDNPEAAARQLEEIRSLGVGVHLDDFGTGYSSLAYLTRFPIDHLKIDGSFVARMNRSRPEREVVRAIAAIAHNLGMGMIAEGVENPEQSASLLALECEFGQGWLYSPALPSDQVVDLLSSGMPLFQPIAARGGVPRVSSIVSSTMPRS